MGLDPAAGRNWQSGYQFVFGAPFSMDPAMADPSVTIRRIDLGGGVGAGFNGMGRDPARRPLRWLWRIEKVRDCHH